jgi:hypothetical protein
MDQLLALSIGGTPIQAPPAIPQGGLPKAYDIGSNFILLTFILVIILALFFLIWGGIRWVTSSGDKTKVQAARNTMIYAIIGLIIVFLSYFVINVITTFFNVPSVTTLPGTSHTGQYGCFDGPRKDGTHFGPACIGYEEGNDPKEPKAWYSTSNCDDACH